MSTRVAVRMTIEVNVNVEVSGPNALMRAQAEVLKDFEAFRVGSRAGDNDVDIHWANSRIETQSVTAMNMGTGDMDK